MSGLGNFLRVFALLLLLPAFALAEPARELRGVWITNVDSDVLASRESIAEAMDFLADAGFNIVFPVVWNKAQTMYPSQEMERRFGIPIDPVYGERDPLRELVIEAHRTGLEVVPWFEFGFSSSYEEGGGHILQKIPEWRALDKDGNLLKKNSFEWMNAFDPEVQDFLTSLLLEVSQGYDIDGVQGDDRLPALPSEGGYDPQTVERFRRAFGKEPPPYHRNSEWLQWRADILTDYLAQVRWRVRRVDPNLLISVSPSIYDWGLREYLQDLRTWTNAGLYDIAHPQAYRYNLDAYKSLIDQMVDFQFKAEDLPKLSPGILIKSGPYVIEKQFLLDCIAFNRARGINGEVLFFYEGLRRNDNTLGLALKEGPYAQPALLPHRNGGIWRPGGIMAEWDVTTGAAGLTVPRAGNYDVYVLLPDEASLLGTGSVGLKTESDDEDLDSVEIDLAASTSRGWVLLGRCELAEGENPGVVVLESDDSSRQLAGKPVMALLNRRHSPDVVWPLD